MKETKVWIDGEFPQVYFDPKTGNESIEGRHFILEDIKTYNRELVKEVCEKIKQDCWCGGAILEDDYYKVPVEYLENLQKDIEK